MEPNFSYMCDKKVARPCHACGSAHMEFRCDDAAKYRQYWMQCLRCGAHGPHGTDTVRAASLWDNTQQRLAYLTYLP